MTKLQFYRCNHCGNFSELFDNSGVPMICCGEKMELLTPNTVDASKEKHVPMVEVEGRMVHVKVGDKPHPMESAHGITFIYLQTARGGQRLRMNIGEKPEAMFFVMNDEPIAAYAYCNLHGLWMTQIACDCGCDHHHHGHVHTEACGCGCHDEDDDHGYAEHLAAQTADQ